MENRGFALNWNTKFEENYNYSKIITRMGILMEIDIFKNIIKETEAK